MSLAVLDTARTERANARPPPLTAAQMDRADQVIAALARLWPQCFQVDERCRRPLMIGITELLLERMEPAIKAGRISENDIRCALRRYCSSTGYLEHTSIINNPRIDLKGRPEGAVTEKQAKYARWVVCTRKNGAMSQEHQ